MFNKAENFARRTWHAAKSHAFEAYKQGKHVMGRLSDGLDIAKRLHSALKPALKDVGVHKQTKRVLNDFETIRGKVMGAHEQASAAVGAVRKAVPELGL
jgi:hypothetical protein